MIALRNLTRVLKKHFKMHPSRLKTLAQMILSLISSANAQQIGLSHFVETSGDGKAALRKIERFFQQQEMGMYEYATAVIELLQQDGQKIRLIIDRTNWKFGLKSNNYLVLSMYLGKGICIPLFFEDLDKEGNSCTQDRVDLIAMFIDCFGENMVESLGGDREFIGERWCKYLDEKKIPFFFRIKENTNVVWGSKKEMGHVKEFFKHLKVKEIRQLRKEVHGLDVLLEGTRSKEGDLVIIITNKRDIKKMGKILKIYKERWNIETMFKTLKTSGFNLENTHMTIPRRLEKLLMIVSIASILALLYGATQKIPEKKALECKAKSVFKVGLDCLRREIAQFLNETLKILDDVLDKAKSIFKKIAIDDLETIIP